MEDVRLMSTGGRALCCPLKGHGMKTGNLRARAGIDPRSWWSQT